MLIDLRKFARKHRMHIKGVIHVGAHYAQEHETYLSMGIQKVIYIEPCSDAFSVLENKFKGNPNVTLFNCACGAYNGVVTMNVERRNQGQSNSILTPAKHLEHYPDIQFKETEIVSIIELDELEFNRSQYNLLMMDCQGYEGEVLKGAKETLKSMDYVYTEVNTDELYENCIQLPEMDKMLSGFKRVETKLEKQGWGDAIYKR